MATTAIDAVGGGAKLDVSHKRIILASSLGTVFEWYDFYLYGSLAVIIGKQFFSGLNEASQLRVRPARVRRRFRGASVRRAGVRAGRRHGRAQVHLPDHHRDHGAVDVPGRRAAELRDRSVWLRR